MIMKTLEMKEKLQKNKGYIYKLIHISAAYLSRVLNLAQNQCPNIAQVCSDPIHIYS